MSYIHTNILAATKRQELQRSLLELQLCLLILVSSSCCDLDIFSLTFDVLQKLFLRNIDFLNSFSNLLLPKGNKLIEWVDVSRRLEIEYLVQCSWIIHRSDGIGSNVTFLVKNCCKKSSKQHIVKLYYTSLIIAIQLRSLSFSSPVASKLR